MLNTKKITADTKIAANYYCERIENYYFSPTISDIKSGKQLAKAGLKVAGRLCEYFGVNNDSIITKEKFKRIYEGQHALSGKSMLQNKHKVHGIDITFSAPKTVSIEGLVIGNLDVTEFHNQAVDEVMRDIENIHSYQRSNGKAPIKSEGMIYTEVVDGYNRNHEPHIHTHVFLCNITRSRNKIYAIDGKSFMNADFNKFWGAMYRYRLGCRLKKAGYNISYSLEGLLRLDKISHVVESRFSKRQQEILDAMVKSNISKYRAFYETRKKKIYFTDAEKKFVPKDVVKGSWKETYDSLEPKSEEENRKETLRLRKKHANDAVFSVEAIQELNFDRDNTLELERWQLALRRATETSSGTSLHNLLMHYIYELMRCGEWEDISYDELMERLRLQIKKKNILCYKNPNADNEYGFMNLFYTSYELCECERKYISLAGERSCWYDGGDEVDTELEAYLENNAAMGKKTLSGIQRDVVLKLLKSDSTLTMVQGDPGSGKTTCMRAFADILKDKGYNVLGISAQGKAAKNLENESGIKCTTIESYLIHVNKRDINDRNRILVCDEGSMLGSRQAAELFESVREYNDKIIIIGDMNQIESIGAGSVFRILVEDAERAGDLLSLYENFRQEDELLRKIVGYAKEGNIIKGLRLLNKYDTTEQGRLTGTRKKKGKVLFDKLPKDDSYIFVDDNAHKRRQHISTLYDEKTLILSSTRAGKYELDELIRERLFEEGKLDKDTEKEYELARIMQDGRSEYHNFKIARGDIISFTRNEYRNYDIRNGERARVINTNDKSIEVELEDSRVKEIDLDYYNFIEHGYAMTTYKAQGQTFDHVVVDVETRVSSLSDMRCQYVNVTRARKSVKMFCSDYRDLMEKARVKSFKRNTFRINVSVDDIKYARERLASGLDVAPLHKEKEHDMGKDNFDYGFAYEL